MVSSLAENEFNPDRPDQNMLPHTFLPGLEEEEEGGGSEGRKAAEKGGGEETGVWLAKDKERVTEGGE